jgi:hypothetical protein
LEYLLENLLANALTFLSIGVAVYFFLKRDKEGEPSYQVDSWTVLADEGDLVPREVTFYFEKNKINRLVKEKIFFWNNGNGVLCGDHITEKEPLKIVVDADTTVLMYDVVTCTNSASDFAVKKSEQSNELILTYSYLEPEDGAVIEVWHDGKQSDIAVCGKIKGLPKGVKRFTDRQEMVLPPFLKTRRPLKTRKQMRRLLQFLMGFCSIVFIFVGILSLFLADLEADYEGILSVVLSIFRSEIVTDEKTSGGIYIISGIIYAFFSFSLWFARHKPYPKALDETESSGDGSGQ